MNQAQFATQSASIWCGGTESKIKGILAHRGSAPSALISQDLTRKQTTSSGREIHLKEKNASHLHLLWV
jgi:hypothetical protein